MPATVQAAIDSADAERLRSALAESSAAANEVIHWGPDGKNTAHPLHYICDKYRDKTLSTDVALGMTDILLAAGSNVNGLPTDNETPLHGAAGLSAEDVGVRLVDAGANIHGLGAFARETPLHWAAHEGLDRLVTRLLAAGAKVDVRDTRWNATVAEWAEHGLRERRPGSTGRQETVIEILKRAAA